MKIETKFSIGQRVLFPQSRWTEQKEICGDCQGQKLWRSTKPNGDTIDTPCPTCRHGHMASTGHITTYRYRPVLTEGEIARVTVELGTGCDGVPRYAIDAKSEVGLYIASQDALFTAEERKSAHVKAISLVIQSRRAFERNYIERTITSLLKRRHALEVHEAKLPLEFIEKEDFGPMLDDWKAAHGY